MDLLGLSLLRKTSRYEVYGTSYKVRLGGYKPRGLPNEIVETKEF